MKITVFVTLLLIIVLNVFSQNNNEQKPINQNNEITIELNPFLYTYKNYDDFFSNNKTYVGKCIEGLHGNSKFKCIDTITNQVFKIKLKDSTNVKGFSCGYKNQKFILDHQNNYAHYICGNSKLLVIYYCDINSAMYDENGEILRGTFLVDDKCQAFRFIKNLDFKNEELKFEDIIKDKPEIYKQYLAEKKEDKEVFKRRHIDFYKKYIKLYCSN